MYWLKGKARGKEPSSVLGTDFPGYFQGLGVVGSPTTPACNLPPMLSKPTKFTGSPG